MAQIALAFMVAVFAAVLPTAAYVLILWWLDRYEKEPVWLFSLAFLWGAVPAVGVSLIAELLLRLPESSLGGLAGLLDSSLTAPMIEEAAKAAALVAIYWLCRAEFDGVLDGIIYGGAIGFGFAMTENILYLLGQLVEAGPIEFTVLWVLRVLIFGLNHALFASVTGVGLGLARMSRQAWRRWLMPLLAFAAAVTLHATHNLFATLAGTTCWSMLVSLTCDWGGLAVILAVIILSWRQERRWLATQLCEEVAYGVISAGEYAILTSPGQRLAATWQALSRQGWPAARAWRQRVAWATELAFKKEQFATVGPTAGEAEAIGKLRAYLRGLS